MVNSKGTGHFMRFRCGYVLSICLNTRKGNIKNWYADFCASVHELFPGLKIDISERAFSSTAASVYKSFRNMKSSLKKLFIDHFSVQNFKNKANDNNKHKISGLCNGCIDCFEHLSLLETFPGKVLENNFQKDVVNIINGSKTPYPNPHKVTLQCKLKHAKKLYNLMNRAFINRFGRKISLAVALTKIPSLKLKLRNGGENDFRIQKGTIQKIKKTMEKEIEKYQVVSMLSSNESLRQYENKRKVQFFESPEKAKNRDAKRRKIEEETGKKKSHIPSFRNLQFDKERIKKKAEECLEKKVKLNCHLYALNNKIFNTSSKQNISATSAAQVFKEYLLKNGFCDTIFKNIPRFRRKKRIVFNNELSINIPLPTPLSARKISEGTKEKIEKGYFNLGEPIVERSTVKHIYAESGEIKEETVKISGRKYLLLSIREKSLKLFEEKGYIRPKSDSVYAEMCDDDVKARIKLLGLNVSDFDSIYDMKVSLKKLERTRHIRFWHDHSPIANRGYVLHVVSFVYNQSFYLTSSEYAKIYNSNVDIQAEVESPHIYILARSRSTDEEQMMFSLTRLECLKDLVINFQLSCGTLIQDVMRFFHGDSPAQGFEFGNKAGSTNHPCVNCNWDARFSADISRAINTEYRSVQDRIDVIKPSPLYRNQVSGTLNPFNNLKKKEAVGELERLNVEIPEQEKAQDVLSDALSGIVRAPALLFPMPYKNISDHNIDCYENLSCEPLHSCKEHIKNLLTELKHHLSKEAKVQYLKIYETKFGVGKNMYRGRDYREALVEIYFAVNKMFRDGLVDQKIVDLLETLIFINRHMYELSVHRSPRAILQLYNLTYKHGTLLHEIMGKPHELTSRKLYGVYYHNIVCEAPRQYRILSLSSSDAEQQERLFKSIKATTSSTNYKGDHVLTNALTRLSAKEIIKARTTNCQANYASPISRLAASMSCKASYFSSDEIKCRSYQDHIQRLGDYFISGKNWWKETDDGGVLFFDGDSMPNELPQGPIMTTFITTNMKKEDSKLKEFWNNCVEKTQNDGLILPIPFIRIRHMVAGLPRYTKVYTGFGASNDINDSGINIDDIPNEEQEIDTFEEIEREEENKSESEETEETGEEQREVIVILPREEEVEVSNEETSAFKTSWGKMLYQCLGPSEILKEYDEKRYAAKRGQCPLYRVQNLEKQLVKSMTTAYRDLKDSIELWEDQFFKDHKCVAEEDDYDSHIASQFNKKKKLERMAREMRCNIFTAA